MAFINALTLPLALLIDRIVGDPESRYHPVALLGSFIGWWGRPSMWPCSFQRTAGVVMWVVTAACFTLPFFLAAFFLPWFVLILAGPLLLKICLAWRSLEDHTLAVDQALVSDISRGRGEVARMVSRDTSSLNEDQVLSAAYESLSENLVDSITAPLFYFGILGLPGAALYRAANTMDAMLGYQDERKMIGWFSARMDDLLTYLPARITGAFLLLYFASRGRFHPAYEGLKTDRKKRPGINGGIPLAIIAGGTGVRFDKPGVYQMGKGERSLHDAGPDIIAAGRAVTLGFSLAVCIALILWGYTTIYSGI
ncbi:MAG: cobalamin biosynthesis protein CobD [Methanoregulaceae archaeon]|nr:cobalamin biosynthesis protein CobD [Methanoregulaceae archaeon]